MVENEYVIDISTNADPTPLEDLGEKIQLLVDAVGELRSSFENITSGGIDDSVSSSEEAANGLDNASGSISNLQSELDGIDGGGLV